MKRITSRKASRRSSISKPAAPKGGLQYFTYDDVGAAAAPEVGEFPQHGDTVALGDVEHEVEAARSRASRRLSQTLEGRGHEDIFANAPEEPLAPEEPRRSSRRGSRRSSRRVSRRSSLDGGLGPASARDSRAISPERDDANGYTSSHSRRDSNTGRRISRRTSDSYVGTPHESEAHISSAAPAAAAAATAAAAASSSRSPPPEQVHSPIAQTKSRSSYRPSAVSTPAHASGHDLTQVPTAEDTLSRAQTRVSSGMVSRQSTAGGELNKRTSILTTGSTKSKSTRKSRRPSKPEPLKYFTYDDVVEAQPPKFGQPPPLEVHGDRESRTFKGKEREQDLNEGSHTPEDAPQVPELPQKLAHMDLTGTGLTRSSTKDTRVGRRDAQRASAPVGSPTSANLAPGSPEVMRASTGAVYAHPQAQRIPAASHGPVRTNTPGNRRAPAPPPPVNMTNKPPSKRPSREFNGSAAAAAGAAVVGAGAAGLAAERGSRPQQARTSSFQEDLPESQKQPQAAPGPLGSILQPVIDRTRQAVGSILPSSQTPETPGVGGNGQDAGFVSAPSSPHLDKSPFSPPPATQAAVSGTTNGNGNGKVASRQIIREERLTREVHTYDASNPSKPIVSLEVLSKRYFMQLDDGRFVEVVERDVPQSIVAASRS